MRLARWPGSLKSNAHGNALRVDILTLNDVLAKQHSAKRRGLLVVRTKNSVVTTKCWRIGLSVNDDGGITANVTPTNMT